LIRTVLEDEAMVGGHARHIGLEGKRLLGVRRRGRGRQQQGRQADR
jgi:hypothetical protein